MPKVSSIKQPYFSHDYSTREAREIKLIIEDYGFAGYGLWWALIEYMHQNILKVGEERLVVGKQHEPTIKSILNDYGLFKIEEDCYISARILRNLEEQEEKTKTATNAVNTRWLMSTYKKYYKEIFDIDVVLSDKEIKKLKDYEKKIKEFKNELPDILYTLSTIKFDNGISTKARSNWLLTDDNLAKIHNGQYGSLKSWKKAKEARAHKPEPDMPLELSILPTFSSKIEAMEFIVQKNKNLDFIHPMHKSLLEQFDITIKELKEHANVKKDNE